MNSKKYTARLSDFSITRDNWQYGEDPDTTQYDNAPVRHVQFNTIAELKKEFSRHFDTNEFYIMHNEGNRYDVQWLSSDESGMFAPSPSEMEAFKRGERDMYSCTMQIELYKVEAVEFDEVAGQLD